MRTITILKDLPTFSVSSLLLSLLSRYLITGVCMLVNVAGKQITNVVRIRNLDDIYTSAGKMVLLTSGPLHCVVIGNDMKQNVGNINTYEFPE